MPDAPSCRLRSIFNRTLLLALLFLACGLIPVAGQTFSIVSITCTSTGQTCTPVYSNTFTSGGGPATFTISAPKGHCSNVAYVVTVDGVRVGITAFLEPGITASPLTTSSLT